jgi:hypothetical protein
MIFEVQSLFPFDILKVLMVLSLPRMGTPQYQGLCTRSVLTKIDWYSTNIEELHSRLRRLEDLLAAKQPQGKEAARENSCMTCSYLPRFLFY